MSTSTIERTEQVTTEDPAQCAHIVLLPAHLRATTTPQAYITQACVDGTPVRALCGHVWVPHRNPKALPVCQICRDIFEDDPRGHGDRDELPDA